MNMIEVTISMDAETKQRVDAAVAEEHVSLNDFLLTAVKRRLDDRRPESTNPRITKEESLQLLERMAARRERILAERNGEFIDVNAILDEVRDEHDAELYGLH